MLKKRHADARPKFIDNYETYFYKERKTIEIIPLIEMKQLYT